MTRGPWSVKGIDPKAREAARERAQREGVTLGALLNRLLLEDDDAPILAPNLDDRPSFSTTDTDEVNKVADVVDDLARRLEMSEKRSSSALAGVDKSLMGLVARIESAENGSRETLGRFSANLEELRQTQSALRGQMTQSRGDDTSKRALEAMKGLEGALSRLVAQIHERQQNAEDRQDDFVATVEANISRVDDDISLLGGKVETSNQQVEDAVDRMSHAAARIEALESSAGSKVDQAIQRLEAASDETARTKDLADKLFGRVDALETNLQSSHSNVTGMMGRVSETASRLERLEHQSDRQSANLDTAVDRINDRLKRAEQSADAAIKSLETSFGSVDARLAEMQRNVGETSDLRETFQRRFDGLTEDMARALADTRSDMTRRIEEAAQSARPEAMDKLDAALSQLQSRLTKTEDRQAQLVETVSEQLTRMSSALDQRLSALEARKDAPGADGLQEEFAELSSEFESRLSSVEARGTDAIETIAEEVGKLTDRLEARVGDSERQTAQAIETVGDQVSRLTDRMEARQDEALQGLSDKLDAAERAGADKLNDALEDMSRRFEDIAEAADNAVEPLRSTVSSIAKRVELLEDGEADPPPYDEPPYPDGSHELEANDGADSENDDADDALFSAIIPDDIDPATAEYDSRNEDDVLDDAAEIETLSDLEADLEALDPIEDAVGDVEDPDFDPVADLLDEDLDADISDEPTPLAAEEPSLPSDEDGDAAELDASEDSLDDAFEIDEDEVFESLLDDETDDQTDNDDVLSDPDTPFRSDQGRDDDPFSEGAKPNEDHRGDYLTAARRAALQSPARDARLEAAAAAATAKSRGSKLPVMAASALAIAVAGGGAAALMRGKQEASFDIFAAANPTLADADGAAAGEPVVATNISATAPEDTPEPDDDLFAADPEAELFDAADEITPADAAEIDDAVLFPTASEDADETPADIVDEVAEAFQPIDATELTRPASLEDAAASGDLRAVYELALRDLANGEKARGAEQLRRAANGGLTIAQYRLGKLYERGDGVPRSVAESRTWTERAASAGNVKAMHDLAVFYADGDGGPQSYAAAATWFLKAANAGLVDSQYNAGVLYEQGLGVSQNPAEAAYWYEIAGRAGDPDGARRALELSRATPGVDYDAVRALAEAFTPEAADDRANGRFGPPPWETATAAEIQTVQRALGQLGFDAGPADGVMGAQTRRAIRAFERSAELPASGQVSQALIDKLTAAARGA